MKLHELLGVEGFNGVGLALQIHKLDFKNGRLIHLYDGTDLAFEQIEIR